MNTPTPAPSAGEVLAACPFCGENSAIGPYPVTTGHGYNIDCGVHWCGASMNATSRDGVIRLWNTRHSAPADAGDPADIEGDIRIAIWNAGMNGGMGQDPTLAFIKRAMAEPTMMRALAALSTTNQQHPQSNDKEG